MNESIDYEGNLSPYEFLKSRRPERFADTIFSETLDIDRSYLEYQLDTLTSRNQEHDFENFVRKIAEREICPNLLPQTGPTGGGDSKVDSETYPVAESLTLSWYSGIGGTEASQERWGFAFSAKKDWRPKIRSDIEKLVKTDRDYKKAFFITNQFVRDKTRSEVEDGLRKKHLIDVRIFDRNWLLDRIFEGNHLDLVESELHISTDKISLPQLGPQDAKKAAQLNNLENSIKTQVQKQEFNDTLIENCIQVAILSAELELPRTETNGRFQRAEQIIDKHGNLHQRIESTYQKAWITFWWFEEIDIFPSLYFQFEELVQDTENIYHLELLNNLWSLLLSISREANGIVTSEEFTKKTDFLLKSLERIADDEYKPSASLQAKNFVAMVNLTTSIGSDEIVSGIFKTLEDIALAAEGLVGYPFSTHAKIIIELGDFLGTRNGYQELFETILSITERREGEIAKAQLLLNRGRQHLSADDHRETLRTLGSSLSLLYKHETRKEIIDALLICVLSYKALGLYWAARGTLLIAGSLIGQDFIETGTVSRVQWLSYNQMKWIELRLGRIPLIFEWYLFDESLKHLLLESGTDPSALESDSMHFEMIFGIFLLNSDFSEISNIPKLISLLDRLELQLPALSIKYLMGYEEELSKEVELIEAFEVTSWDTFFQDLWNQPANLEFISIPDYCDGDEVTLTTNILGCNIIITAENIPICVQIGESLLAALESLLATSSFKEIIAHMPEYNIKILSSELANYPFEYSSESLLSPNTVIHSQNFRPDKLDFETQNNIQKLILEINTKIILEIAHISNPDNFFENLFAKEKAPERAVNFTGSFITTNNLIGSNIKSKISDWFDKNDKEYHPLRENPIKFETVSQSSETMNPPDILIESNSESFLDSAQHSDIKNISIINIPLWDKAKWQGVLYLTSANFDTPPILGLFFKDKESGIGIFNDWLASTGKTDIESKIRISVILGINKHFPNNYRVTVGVNSQLYMDSKKVITSSTRVHTLEPSSLDNLNRFIQSYEIHKKYFIAPATGSISNPQPLLDYCIFLSEINIIDAWKIGIDSLDSLAIYGDEDVIIPTEEKKPPIIDLIKHKSKKDQ